MVRWVVSLESVPTPARTALLAALAGRLGLHVAEDQAPSAEPGPAAGPLDSLLARMTGLARLPADAHAVWTSSCLLDVPAEPTWRRIYDDLAQELVERLVPGGVAGTRHLMLCLDVDPDEAFETLFDGGTLQGNGCPLVRRESCLDDVLRCCGLVSAAARADTVPRVTPFEARRVLLRCPRFAADNPAAMAALENVAVRACADAIGAAPATAPPARP